MSIKTNKIQVFTGVNDQPTPPSNSQGCNGSYLIDKFNKAVDELSDLLEFQPNYHPQGLVEIYVDTVNGNDNNSGLSVDNQGNYTLPSPVLTLKKGLEIASKYTAVSYARIYIYKIVSWNLTAETLFDFRALKAVPYSDWEDTELGFTILPWTPDSQPPCNVDLLYDTNEEMGLLAPWIMLPIDDQTYISFFGWKFISNNRPLAVFGNRIKFDQCIFSAIAGAYESCLWIQDCQSPILNECTFMIDGGNIWAFLVFYNCNIAFFNIPAKCCDGQFNDGLYGKTFIGVQKSFLHQVIINDFQSVLPNPVTFAHVDAWYGLAQIRVFSPLGMSDYTFARFV